MHRFNPSTKPIEAIERGFYVEPPNPLAARIANRLDLEPTSSHLVVGGIGSGKTTTLLIIKQVLSESDDMVAAVVDVPGLHQLGAMKPGVLLAIAGAIARGKLIKQNAEESLDLEVKKAAARVKAMAVGEWEYDPGYPDHGYDDENQGEHWVQGILRPPGKDPTIEQLRNVVAVVVGALPRRLVVLLDGLDRLDDVGAFKNLVMQDVPAMNRAGIGVVVVGPQQSRFRLNFAVQELFSAFHLHGALPVGTDDGGAFLSQVLRARADATILPDETCLRLAHFSGGLLRDLIGLARAAGEEAYAAGADQILPEHVNLAAHRFGRNLLLGITAEQAKRLRDFVEVPRYGKKRAPQPKELRFTLATELDLSLLLGRLIIEVQDVPLRYIPHPTTVELIAGLPT